MQTRLRTTSQVALTSLVCSLLGAVLATAFEAHMSSAVLAFAAFGGFMAFVYRRDRDLSNGKPQRE